MKYTFSIILFLIFAKDSLAQDRFFKIDSVLNSVTNNSLEKIATYRSAYQSYNVISDGYIFWRKADSNYIQKIQCSEYPNEQIYIYDPLKAPENDILKFFNQEKKELLNEGLIKSFEHKNSGWIDGVYNTGKPLTPHGRYSRIIILLENPVYDRHINHFDLNESTDLEKKHRNIHYNYNNELKLVTLEKAFYQYIIKLNEKNFFKDIEKE